MNRINKLISEIREFISDHRKQEVLLSDIPSWNKLLSCLDTICDNELALESFIAFDWPNDYGKKYLLIYGILQAMVVQQKAVEHLYKSLNLQYTKETALINICEIRNDSVGHPTQRNKTKTSNFIARITIHKNGFMLMTTYPDRRPPTFKNVNIPELINQQREILESNLLNLLEKLKQDEREHRKMFRGRKLKDIFHRSLYYSIEKIYESIYAVRPNKFGELHVDIIRNCVEQFLKALEERGILNVYNSINDLIYPLDELKKYFSSPDQSKLDAKDARIFIFFLEKMLEVQEENAKEIDQKYETEVP